MKKQPKLGRNTELRKTREFVDYVVLQSKFSRRPSPGAPCAPHPSKGPVEAEKLLSTDSPKQKLGRVHAGCWWVRTALTTQGAGRWPSAGTAVGDSWVWINLSPRWVYTHRHPHREHGGDPWGTGCGDHSLNCQRQEKPSANWLNITPRIIHSSWFDDPGRMWERSQGRQRKNP